MWDVLYSLYFILEKKFCELLCQLESDLVFHMFLTLAAGRFLDVRGERISFPSHAGFSDDLKEAINPFSLEGSS